MNNNTLVFKWLKSENCSSRESKELAKKTRQAFGLTSRQYRKLLSWGREKTKILETLMSENRWDEVQFDHLPSRAGLIYSNAFKNREETKERYEEFINSKTTKVNANVLYPYEAVNKALHTNLGDKTARNIANKYWENLPDYFEGKSSNMLCVVDTSGSMCDSGAAAPINVAISLGMYAAEHMTGPLAGKYISFASRPQLIDIVGTDFCDKVRRIYETNLCDNTNLTAVFDLLKDTILRKHVAAKDIPTTIVVISDMEIDDGTARWDWYWTKNSPKYNNWTEDSTATEMEKIRLDWAAAGLRLPKLVYWDVQSRHDRILDAGPGVSFVSGMSPVIFKAVLTGKTGYQLMIETICADRYNNIHA